MKTTLACLCGLLLSASFHVQADDGDIAAHDKLVITSLNEVNMTTATVLSVFEYCMKQDPDFSQRSMDSLDAWKARNMDYVALTPVLREEAIAIGLRTGLTRAETEEIIDNAAAEVGSTFPTLLEKDSDVARRVHVCDVYVGMIREGELDIANDEADQLRYLKSRVEATQR